MYVHGVHRAFNNSKKKTNKKFLLIYGHFEILKTEKNILKNKMRT